MYLEIPSNDTNDGDILIANFIGGNNFLSSRKFV